MLRQADSTTAGEPVSAFASASTPALAAMRHHVEQAVQIQTVRQVLARAALQAVYQPIVRLQTGVVMGHEALIRGPLESPLQRPDALFQSAREEGLTVELEQACLAQCLQAWAGHAADKRLFVNLSANALVLAEGIETAEELHIARDLGIEYGQGYFLGRPAGVPAPLMLDKHTGLNALTAVLRSPDQRYLTEGFIVTEGGC
jgi:EAL domain-containing protein (putative c-di-GMP-specific phosphodiesterase class I)